MTNLFNLDSDFKAAGSRSAFKKTAGSGSTKNECGSSALPRASVIRNFFIHIYYIGTASKVTPEPVELTIGPILIPVLN